MVACPFDVPKFDWHSGLTPVIGKCQFCTQDRLAAGLSPACSEACPTGVLKFGKRSNLLFEARTRIRARPERYVDHIFGEKEVGGTSWMYLSEVPFDTLGFKTRLPHEPLPSLTWQVIAKIPAVVTALAVVFGVVATTLSKGGEES
ncbi:MAG: 4Fe-4S dicluster domain-containing protein, partial [Pseudomonadota bacterium]